MEFDQALCAEKPVDRLSKGSSADHTDIIGGLLMNPEQVKKFFKQTISTIYSANFGLAGLEKAVVATNVPCRWENRVEYLLDQAEQQIVSRAVAFLGPDVPVSEGSIVVFEGKEYNVIQVEVAVDGEGSAIFKKIWVN